MANIFSSDWFKRNSNFTHANTSNKLGWEGSLTSKYSSYLYGSTRANALLSSSGLLSGELRTIATSLGVNTGVSVSIDSKAETSMTDGKNIIISNKFDTEVGDNYDTLDLIIGLLCHESAHCLYTDFNYMLAEIRREPIDSLVKWIQNLIEDELIETKLGDKFPGYINFISQVKYYYFDKCCADIIDSECKTELDKIMRLLLYVVRYPKYISTVDPGVLATYNKLFTDIRGVLAEYGCLEAKYNEQITRLSLICARRIYELLKDYIDNQDQNESDDNGNTGKGDGESEEGDSENSGSGEGKGNSDVPSDLDGGKGNSASGSQGKSFDEQKSEMMADDESTVNKVMKAQSACTSSSETQRPAMYGKILNEKKDDFAKEIVEDIKHSGFMPLDSIGVADAVQPDMIKYQKAVMSMRPYINECKKLFFTNDKKVSYVNSRFHRNGNLDTTRLVDAMARVNTIYTQRQQVNLKKDARFALVLTLDESGSMSWTGNHKKASNIAIMITEAAKDFPGIELFVYGHGDDVVTYINKKTNKKFSLANRKLQMEQNEELAYAHIIEEVRKQTHLPIVVLNITDSAYLSNPTAVHDLLEGYKKHNCSFNCICLSGDGMSASESQFNDEIYGADNWVKITHTDNEVSVMIHHLAKIIEKNYNKR